MTEKKEEYSSVPANEGMFLRDAFAIVSLKGILASPELNAHLDYIDLAASCYKQADAMLEARKKK